MHDTGQPSMSRPARPCGAMAREAELVARLRRVPASERCAMYEAAAEAIACLARMAERGVNPTTAVLGGADTVAEWAHYPPGDAIDPATHSRYYYHAHSAAERVDREHGHFHTFVRPQAFFPELEPIVASAADAGASSRIAHLVGISVDAAGDLVRLFTTNRWVTDETWFDADSVSRMLPCFDMTLAGSRYDLHRWITAVVRLFRPQIEDLMRARDASIAAFRAAHPDEDVYESRGLSVTSEAPVDLLMQIRAIELSMKLGRHHRPQRRIRHGA